MNIPTEAVEDEHIEDDHQGNLYGEFLVILRTTQVYDRTYNKEFYSISYSW